jgi:hypothetical protein
MRGIFISVMFDVSLGRGLTTIDTEKDEGGTKKAMMIWGCWKQLLW